MDSHCVVCGTYVPEGRTICPLCEKGENMDKWTLQEEAFKRGYEKGKADSVVHGMWHKYHDYFTKRQVGWICTNCSAVTYDLSNGDTQFCPHCGALMDLEDEDDK
jgi:RNA polymerase subunit RPABC4/transcription elongation factor Spt4